MSKTKKVIGLILISLILITGTSSLVSAEKFLPAGAAPEQILYYPLRGDTGTYVDFMKTIYQCIFGVARIVQEPLFQFNKDLEVVPMGTESWEVSNDGLNWTFHLRKELKWSDGKPITAHNYVFGLQRAVEQGYDFSWYWKSAAGIKNWESVEKGELPIEELGIKALDDYTLEITTNVHKPYLLGVLVLLYPVPQHAVIEYGDEYATKADTMVGNGPFKIAEWIKGSHITCITNPNYSGIWKPYLQEVILKYGTIDTETGFPAYLNDEICKSNLNSGQLPYVRQNIPEELHSWPALQFYYLSFDTTKPPFDDVRVRQAFNYALNREELCSTVLKDVVIPEYSPLMSGFPGYDPIEAKNLSQYNIEIAKALLAESGYPEGEGFPEQELWIKKNQKNTIIHIPAATYLQAQFKEKLGIDIIPRIIERKTYIDAMNQYTHNFFFEGYPYDYIDPSNFMDLFLSGGPHAWSNPEYDNLVNEADTTQDWDKRIANYRKAEKILIQEAPIVAAFQEIDNAVWKPYLKGEGVEPNKDGIIIWDSNLDEYIFTHIYIAKH